MRKKVLDVPPKGYLLKMPEFENATVEKRDSDIVMSIGNSKIIIPREFPEGKTYDSRFDLYGKKVCAFFYDSDWREFRSKCYGLSVILLNKGKLQLLPNVAPETVIYLLNRRQMIISRVEKSPFGCPSAAILTLDEIGSTDDISSLYVFPSKPIIIEGHASTAWAGRVHEASNVAGTGLNNGNVPHIYAWVSPDEKEHGWAFAMYKKWELDSTPRPKIDWIKDRCIYYDPIWYDNGNEPYNLYLGKRVANFPSLPVNFNKEITRFQIEKVFRKSVNPKG